MGYPKGHIWSYCPPQPVSESVIRANQHSHVYIFMHPSSVIMKIGKADFLRERVRSIGISNVDLSCSLALRRESIQSAFETETWWHHLATKWRVDPEVAMKFGVPRDGSTEWFSGKAAPRLHAEIALFTAEQDRLYPKELSGHVLGPGRRYSRRLAEEDLSRFKNIAIEHGLSCQEGQ